MSPTISQSPHPRWYTRKYSWLVVLWNYVALPVFQPYPDLEAADQKIQNLQHQLFGRVFVNWHLHVYEILFSHSMQNNLEKSHGVCVLHLFCTFLDKNGKNYQSHHWGRDEGISSSCPRFATSMTRQASSRIANIGHPDGIPSSLPQCDVRFF